MKKALIFSIILLTTKINAQPFQYISSKPISCANNTFEIEVRRYSNQTSETLITHWLEFGDGSSTGIPIGDFILEEISNGSRLEKFNTQHTFPGSGNYKLSLRYFNRYFSISNMQNSVNTPLYVETNIIVDPYIGCNSTPTLEYVPLLTKKGTTFKWEISFTDEENDSISYSLDVPLQDAATPVVEYQFPMDHESVLHHPISKIVLDPINGSLFLNSKNLEGLFTIALKAIEWRKVDGIYYQISNTTLDYTLTFFDDDNHPPALFQVMDTAIVAGRKFEHSIVASDPDQDSIQVNYYGDLFPAFELVSNNSSVYLPGPMVHSVSFTPSLQSVRTYPYKGIFSANDKIFSINKSMYLWIADKEHLPGPILYFLAHEVKVGVIELEWIDVDDELGYIIERSDQCFPEFHKITVLPQNTISYHDSSVVLGNTYQYRIKAVGTAMSPYKMTEVSTTKIVTSLIEDQQNEKPIRLYPNPSDGIFYLVNGGDKVNVKITDMSGKLMWAKKLVGKPHRPGRIDINTNLESGIYILSAEDAHDQFCQKIFIR